MTPDYSKSLNDRRWISWAILLSSVSLIAAYMVDPYVGSSIPLSVYIPVHSVLEFFSVVVSFTVFAMGWYGYKQTRNRQDFFVASVFAAVAVIDIVHTFSYKGMPDFIGMNSVGKAAAYWLAARLIGALGLFLAAFVRPDGRSWWTNPKVVFVSVSGISIAVITLVSLNGRLVGDLMYQSDTGLTTLKKTLEYFVVIISVGAFYAFSVKKSWLPESVRWIRVALIVSMASEVCFTLYASPYDAHNLLGHLLKVVVSYCVLQALFVSALSRPYKDLSRMRHELENSFVRIGEALSTGLEKEPTLKLISSLARRMFDADIAAIGEVRSDGIVEIRVFDGITRDTIRVPVDVSLTGIAFSTGKPVTISDITDHEKARPEILSMGVKAFMSAPFYRDGVPVGAVYVWSRTPGKFVTEDGDLLMAFARHASIAVGNAEYFEREHHIADSLQQVLFPPAGVNYYGYDIAAKYEPALDEARVGGDFYDYFDLGSGKIAILIGDVSGKGLDAAVHTAMVKYYYRAYLRMGYSVSQSVAMISQAFEEQSDRSEVPMHVFVTLFCAIIDVESGKLIYTNAGHEPPLLRSATGEICELDSTGPIVGLNANLGHMEVEVGFGAGDVLVMYTDGITESRIGNDFFGQGGLTSAIRKCNSYYPGDVVEHVYKGANDHANGILRDDVAIVVVGKKA